MINTETQKKKENKQHHKASSDPKQNNTDPSFLLPDLPINSNRGKTSSSIYTCTLDAALWAKGWHLPSGATFLDPCQTLEVNKETLRERQRRARTGLVLTCWLCTCLTAGTSPAPCPLRAQAGQAGALLPAACSISSGGRGVFLPCCVCTAPRRAGSVFLQACWNENLKVASSNGADENHPEHLPSRSGNVESSLCYQGVPRVSQVLALINWCLILKVAHWFSVLGP